MQPRVLLVGYEGYLLDPISRLLRSEGYVVRSTSFERAPGAIAHARPHGIVTALPSGPHAPSPRETLRPLARAAGKRPLIVFTWQPLDRWAGGVEGLAAVVPEFDAVALVQLLRRLVPVPGASRDAAAADVLQARQLYARPLSGDLTLAGLQSHPSPADESEAGSRREAVSSMLSN